MNRLTKRSIILGWLSTSTAVLLTSAPLLAQDATVGVGATTTIPSRARAAEPGEAREGRPTTIAVPSSSAHEAVVGRLGVGWLGTADVPVGPASQAGNAPIPTPIVGVRYWLNSTLGIDAGLGVFTISSATRTEATTNVTVEGPARTSFVLHAGVPIALADAGNFTFLVIPELDVGIGTGSIKGTGGMPNTDLSGFLLEGGLRAGAEVFFGFIGIPQLSLEGSVGVFLSSSSGKVSSGGASTRFSSFVLSTSSVAQPWDIFRKDIAARYYF
jgi:hypothetical protein